MLVVEAKVVLEQIDDDVFRQFPLPLAKLL